MYNRHSVCDWHAYVIPRLCSWWHSICCYHDDVSSLSVWAKTKTDNITCHCEERSDEAIFHYIIW